MHSNGSMLILDCDGVLIDSEWLASKVEIAELRRFGCSISIEEYLDEAVGRSEEGEVWARIAALNRVRLPSDFVETTRRKVGETFQHELQPIPGVEAALDRILLAKAVASGSRRERLTATLRQTRLDRFFGERIFSAEEVARGKPAPDVFLHAAARCGVSPESCLVVEDSLLGVTAASAAGMAVVGFVGASHCRAGLGDRLRQAGASRVFADMDQLPELCEELFNQNTRKVRSHG